MPQLYKIFILRSGWKSTYTVWMKMLTIFSVDMHLPHHHKSGLAHLSGSYSLVIGLCRNLKDEQKNQEIKD